MNNKELNNFFTRNLILLSQYAFENETRFSISGTIGIKLERNEQFVINIEEDIVNDSFKQHTTPSTDSEQSLSFIKGCNLLNTSSISTIDAPSRGRLSFIGKTPSHNNFVTSTPAFSLVKGYNIKNSLSKMDDLSMNDKYDDDITSSVKKIDQQDRTLSTNFSKSKHNSSLSTQKLCRIRLKSIDVSVEEMELYMEKIKKLNLPCDSMEEFLKAESLLMKENLGKILKKWLMVEEGNEIGQLTRCVLGRLIGPNLAKKMNKGKLANSGRLDSETGKLLFTGTEFYKPVYTALMKHPSLLYMKDLEKHVAINREVEQWFFRMHEKASRKSIQYQAESERFYYD